MIVVNNYIQNPNTYECESCKIIFICGITFFIFTGIPLCARIVFNTTRQFINNQSDTQLETIHSDILPKYLLLVSCILCFIFQVKDCT